MTSSYIEDRAEGPIVVGTRITVDDVLTYLLDPTLTEDVIAGLLHLSLDQVAAARAYVLAHPDTTLGRHLEIDARSDAAVNPPEVVERATRMRDSLIGFRAWLADREATGSRGATQSNGEPGRLPSFREWLAKQEPSTASGA